MKNICCYLSIHTVQQHAVSNLPEAGHKVYEGEAVLLQRLVQLLLVEEAQGDEVLGQVHDVVLDHSHLLGECLQRRAVVVTSQNISKHGSHLLAGENGVHILGVVEDGHICVGVELDVSKVGGNQLGKPCPAGWNQSWVGAYIDSRIVQNDHGTSLERDEDSP